MYLVSPVTKRNTLDLPPTYQRQMKILNLRFPPKTISTILKSPGGDDCILVSGGFRSKYTTPPYLPRKVRLELEQQMKEKKMREDAGRCLAMFLQRAPPAYQKNWRVIKLLWAFPGNKNWNFKTSIPMSWLNFLQLKKNILISVQGITFFHGPNCGVCNNKLVDFVCLKTWPTNLAGHLWNWRFISTTQIDHVIIAYFIIWGKMISSQIALTKVDGNLWSGLSLHTYL